MNEASVAGALANTFTADKITGNYVEVITFNGAPASGSFDVSLRWNAGQFVANDGKDPVASQLGGIAASNYGLYALYKGSGTYTNNGTQTTFNFTPGGSLRLFSDADNNTTFNQPTNGAAGFTTGYRGLVLRGAPRVDRTFPDAIPGRIPGRSGYGRTGVAGRTDGLVGAGRRTSAGPR